METGRTESQNLQMMKPSGSTRICFMELQRGNYVKSKLTFTFPSPNQQFIFSFFGRVCVGLELFLLWMVIRICQWSPMFLEFSFWVNNWYIFFSGNKTIQIHYFSFFLGIWQLLFFCYHLTIHLLLTPFWYSYLWLLCYFLDLFGL
jgi:hypothetical protein